MAGHQGIAPAPAPKPVVVATAVAAAPALAAVPRDEVQLLAFAPQPTGPADINGLIVKYAGIYNVPESLIHRVVKRESSYNPKARNGPYYGLMQIRHDTARSMGYKGDAAGLLDADTNLRYAVKYLRGAYIVGDYDESAAMRHYARGYYYDAKRKGLLKEAGLR
jgi:soluble lytic murein transglycosylase-like protein